MAKKRRSPQKRSERPERDGAEAAVPLSRAQEVPLVGDLKRALKESEASWSVNELLSEGDELPRFPLGGMPQDLVLASEAPLIDFDEIAGELPANPFLVERRLELGLVHSDLEDVARGLVPRAPEEAEPPAPKRRKKPTPKETKRGGRSQER